jgi:hypothetical protein
MIHTLRPPTPPSKVRQLNSHSTSLIILVGTRTKNDYTVPTSTINLGTWPTYQDIGRAYHF